jgi:hypothetical protein
MASAVMVGMRMIPGISMVIVKDLRRPEGMM